MTFMAENVMFQCVEAQAFAKIQDLSVRQIQKNLLKNKLN